MRLILLGAATPGNYDSVPDCVGEQPGRKDPLQVGLGEIVVRQTAGRQHTFLDLPMITLFFLGQKYIIKGVVTTGLKG